MQNLSSQWTMPLPTGSNVYLNLEEWGSRELTLLTVPNGISCSSDNENKNKVITKFLRHNDFTAYLYKTFKSSCIWGDALAILLKRKDGNIEVWNNNLLSNLSSVKVLGYTETEAHLSFLVSKNGSHYQVMLYMDTEKLVWQFQDPLLEEEYFKEVGIEKTSFHNLGVLPIYLFQFAPHQSPVGGVLLNKYTFHFACKNMQLIIDEGFDYLGGELVNNRTIVEQGNKTAQELRNDKQKSAGFWKRNIATANNTIPGDLTSKSQQRLIPSEPQFTQYTTLVNSCKTWFKEFCSMPVYQEEYINQQGTNINTVAPQKLIDFLQNFWKGQIEKFIAKVLQIAGEDPFNDKGEYDFDLYLKKSDILNSKEKTSELVYQLRNNIITFEEYIQIVRNYDKVKAREWIAKDLRPNIAKYKDLIFFVENNLDAMSADGHKEDVNDMDDESKINETNKEQVENAGE